MEVNREMLESMLDAALTTARSHRGRPGELYALGQLEATANMIYVMICSQTSGQFGQLEVLCQACASEAVDRLENLVMPLNSIKKKPQRIA